MDNEHESPKQTYESLIAVADQLGKRVEQIRGFAEEMKVFGITEIGSFGDYSIKAAMKGAKAFASAVEDGLWKERVKLGHFGSASSEEEGPNGKSPAKKRGKKPAESQK